MPSGRSKGKYVSPGRSGKHSKKIKKRSLRNAHFRKQSRELEQRRARSEP